MITKGWIGVDPGAKGSACLLTEDGEVDFVDYPKDLYLRGLYEAMSRWMHIFEVRHIVLERVGAMPGNGGVSMFRFGRNAGIWEGMILSWSVPYSLVAPQRWQKGLLTKGDGRNPKERAFAAASRLFPNADLMTVRGKILDGRCDSLLLAEYARRTSL